MALSRALGLLALLTVPFIAHHTVHAQTFTVEPSDIATTVLSIPTTVCSGAVAYDSTSSCPLAYNGYPTLEYGTINGATAYIPYLAYPMTTAALAPRFCVTALQWTFWYVSGSGVFSTDPAEDTTGYEWTSSTLTYNNAATLAPLQSSFSQPTITITQYAFLDLRPSEWNTMTFPSTAISAVNSNIVANNGVYSWRMNRFSTGTANRIFLANVGGPYAPYVSGSYTLCDTNAACSSVSNTCLCNTNYYGTGTSCTIATCAAATIGGITYAGVNAGASSTGNCPTAFVGTATRTCVQSTTCTPATGTNGCPTGTFPDSTLQYNCVQLLCQPPSDVEYNAVYNASVAVGGQMVGYCDAAIGYAGTIARTCTQSGVGNNAVGVLAAPTTSCTVITCPAITAADSNWPATATGGANQAVQSTCNTGYTSTGIPTRTCQADGTWSAITAACTQVQCPAIAADTETGEAAFPSVPWSSTPVQGTCPDLFAYGPNGAATRICTSSGAWATEQNPCVRIQCPALASAYATGAAAYPATDAPSAGTVNGTCPAGWAGDPYRTCTLNGTVGVWSAETAPCVELVCPALADDSNAAWPEAQAGTTATGTCNLGYVQSPPPQRACTLAGTWDTQIINSCAVAFCPGIAYDNANWSPTVAGSSAFGNCSLGYQVAQAGPPSRTCFLNATWAETVNDVCTQRVCPPVQEAYANWTATLAATTATPTSVYGTCEAGFQGSPSRVCTSNGTWGTITGSCLPNECVGLPDCVLNCTQRIEANADWPESLSETIVQGTCVPGWTGAPVRACGQYGAWQEPTTACTQLSCPSFSDAALWPSALSGTQGVAGSCVLGYLATNGTVPTRTCTTVCNSTACTWSATVANPCQQIFCPALTASFQANWAATAAGNVSYGTCIPGYSGAPARPCNLDGSWGALTAVCTQLTCPLSTSDPASDDPTAFWAPVSAGTANVTGTCKALYGPEPGPVYPTRSCQLDGTWSAVVDPCVQLTCPAIVDGLISFPQALAGSAQVFGTCQAGYAGSPQRPCNDVGVWGNVTGACVQNVCGAATYLDASWPAGTLSSVVATGTCLPGYAPTLGTVTRLCQLDGTWAANITGECEQLVCITLQDSNALWPSTAAGATVQGSCDVTYSGSVQRTCQIDATWGSITGSCLPIYCPAQADVNSTSFPATRAATTASGTCLSAFEAGSPTSECSATGIWGEIINPCLPIATTCSADFGFDNAIWPETAAGGYSVGSCVAGFASTGTPLRLCIRETSGSLAYGVWNNATATNPCLFQAGYDGPSVRLTNLTVAGVTSSSLTLSWVPLNGASVFFVTYSVDSLTFYPTGAPVLNATSIVVSGLAEDTVYQFRVVPGDVGGEDALGAGIAGQTYIDPPTNFTVTDYAATSLSFAWAPGSSLTALYLFYIQAQPQGAGGRRSVGGDGFQLALNYTNATQYTATGLTPATVYVVQVRASTADGTTEGVGATLSVRTDTPAEDSSGPVNLALVVSIVGVGVFLIVVVVVGYVVHRRQLAKKQKELLSQYSSQVAMLTLDRNTTALAPTRSFFDMDTLNHSELRANLQVPKTQFDGANATMLNTVMEISLPGYLLMDYSTGLRPEARLTAGGAATIFRGTLVDTAAIQRNGGTTTCAIKLVSDWPALSDEQNWERFHNEVAIMWSLSFHANIIKLVGYTDEPRTLVTRLYPTDLFRYLHAQEDKSTLDRFLTLHLCAGIVSAVATMHSIGVAHRDLKSPNVLMQEPRMGSPYPDPIICDFGISRTSEEATRDLAMIRGISPRYAPPEVFARLNLRHSTNSIEDDKLSDVYSLGVIIWEIVARLIPWDGQSNIEIEQNLRFGMRLPELEVDESDPIYVVLNEIINHSLQSTPADRPASAAINNRLAGVIRQLVAAKQPAFGSTPVPPEPESKW